MVVIIQNPNQMSELVSVQKVFIKAAPHVFYQNTPLWIFLGGEYSECDYTKSELKELADSIQNVEFFSPYVYFSKELQQEVFGSKVIIHTKKDEIEGKIILCKSLKTGNETPRPENKNNPLESAEPYMNLKVFRLANAVKTEPNGMAVTDSVWKKIK